MRGHRIPNTLLGWIRAAWRTLIVLSGGLRARLVGLIVLTVVTSVGWVGASLVEDARALLRDRALSEHLAHADIAASGIADRVLDVQAQARDFAARPLVRATASDGDWTRVSPLLERALRLEPHWDSLEVLATDGTVLATGLPDKSSVGRRTAVKREWLDTVLATEEARLGEPVLSKATHNPTAPYAVPVRDESGAIRAILLAPVSLSRLTQGLDRGGDTARLSVMDIQHEVVLSHPNTERILKPVARDATAVERLLARERGALETHTNQGRPVLVAFVPVPGLSWGVLIREPQAAAYGRIGQLTATATERIAVATLVAVLVAVALALWLTQPLTQLRAAAEAMGRGDLSRRVGIRRQDEIGELAGAFDRMADQLQVMVRTEKMRTLGEMASGVAHDLNQSLAVVASYADVAERSLDQANPDLAQARELLRVVAQAAHDGGEAVRRLLVFGRPAADTPPERIELDSLLRDVAALTAPRWRDAAAAQGRAITLRLEVQAGLAVDGHPPSLREALTNLVLNAVDALPTGGTIVLSASRHGDGARIAVVDDGVGMPPDVRDRALEPFFTTKGERGTGLGLAQVCAIAAQQGANVELASAPGRGTTVSLVFPHVAPPVEVKDAAPSERPTRSRAGRVSPMRVLAVDDEPALSRAVALVLERDGHEVRTADSGEAALAELAASPFDLVISDLGMPGMNGWDLAARVRAGWPAVGFALVTGWGAEIDESDARAHGVDVVIAKPFRARDLLAVVEQVAKRAVATS